MNGNLNANDHDVVDGVLEIVKRMRKKRSQKIINIENRRVGEGRIININTMLKDKCQKFYFIYIFIK